MSQSFERLNVKFNKEQKKQASNKHWSETYTKLFHIVLFQNKNKTWQFLD